MKSILFGDKDYFGIELGFTKTTYRYKLRFWIKGKPLGSFTKAGELNASIREYKKFAINKENYHLPVFDNFSPADIEYYLVGIFFTDEGNNVELKEIDKRQSFYLFFGDQFSNQTGHTLLLYKYPNVIFIIKRPMDGPVDCYEIQFETFRKVFDEYIDYTLHNDLIQP
ncbi:hypothetical protein [Mucilaginibacter sp.]|uniref:hypothetical protein n=1 Tax=Mucilaginibacter sp. TaxID=1882438 RepID=UPI003267F51C